MWIGGGGWRDATGGPVECHLTRGRHQQPARAPSGYGVKFIILPVRAVRAV